MPQNSAPQSFDAMVIYEPFVRNFSEDETFQAVEPVRVEVDLPAWCGVRDIRTGQVAEKVQDLEDHEVRLFEFGVG